jgi:signal transduction histidine kinase
MVRRLIAWQVLAMGVAWVALSAWIVAQMMAFGNGDLDRRMDYFAQALAEAGSAARGDPAELARRLQTTERIFVKGMIGELNAVAAYVPVYQVWTAPGPGPAGGPNTRLLHASPAAPRSALTDLPQGPGTTTVQGQPYRTVAARSTDGQVRVVVAESTKQRWADNWPMLQVIGLSQLLILAWSLSVTWVAARHGFKPLTALAARIAGRAPGDLAPLPVDRVYAETAPIVLAMNSLLAREGRRLETERGFLADAAHELRTPLAAINAQAHVLARTEDAPTRAVVRQELEDGMQRVSHLLSQLLDMARLEAGPPSGATEPLDLADIIRQRLATLMRLARTRAVELAFEAPETLMAQVNRAGFLSILDNLVDNAIRYTPSGGHVLVTLGTDQTDITLAVRDDGPGIAPADRERVFERFVRLPGATEQGSGLGLAIVQRWVDSQAATLRFVDGLSGRGVGFVVRLPGLARSAP